VGLPREAERLIDKSFLLPFFKKEDFLTPESIKRNRSKNLPFFEKKKQKTFER